MHVLTSPFIVDVCMESLSASVIKEKNIVNKRAEVHSLATADAVVAVIIVVLSKSGTVYN